MRTDCAQWRAIRVAQLERFPLCAYCGQPANEVDHIDGDTSRNLIGIDLQSLCKPCHSRKTAQAVNDARRTRTTRSDAKAHRTMDSIARDAHGASQEVSGKSLSLSSPPYVRAPSNAQPRIGSD